MVATALEGSVAGRDHRLMDVFDALTKGNMQLWIVSEDRMAEAIILTEICAFPLTKVLSVFLVGGKDPHLWIEGAEDVLCKFARAKGCDRIEAIGRPGWRKMYEKLGWQSTAVYIQKELRDGEEVTGG